MSWIGMKMNRQMKSTRFIRLGVRHRNKGQVVSGIFQEEWLKSFVSLYIVSFFSFYCRLRHERLKKVPRDMGGPNAYQTLTCFELEDTPPLPNPPSSSSIDDPFDIRIWRTIFSNSAWAVTLSLQLVSKSIIFHDQQMFWRQKRISVNTICEMRRVKLQIKLTCTFLYFKIFRPAIYGLYPSIIQKIMLTLKFYLFQRKNNDTELWTGIHCHLCSVLRRVWAPWRTVFWRSLFTSEKRSKITQTLLFNLHKVWTLHFFFCWYQVREQCSTFTTE